MHKSRIDYGMEFINAAMMNDATGSEKVIDSVSILSEIMLDCRELLTSIDRRMMVRTPGGDTKPMYRTVKKK